MYIYLVNVKILQEVFAKVTDFCKNLKAKNKKGDPEDFIYQVARSALYAMKGLCYLIS